MPHPLRCVGDSLGTHGEGEVLSSAQDVRWGLDLDLIAWQYKLLHPESLRDSLLWRPEVDGV